LAPRWTDIRSTASPPSAAARLAASRRAVDLAEVPWLIAMALAAVYVIVFVVLFPRNMAQLGWAPEVGSGFVMAETLAEAGTGGFALMGSTGQWVPLWFGEATAWLPLHRAIWIAAPTLVFVATALIVGWCVAQFANRRATILAVLMVLVASPLALAFFMVPFAHNAVYPCTALLGAYLIWLTRGANRRGVTAFLVPPILGVVIGACVSSDPLLVATAVVPLGVTALLTGVRRERRSRIVALSALSTVAVTVPVAKFISHEMTELHYFLLPRPIVIASLSELPERLLLLYRGMQALFNGYLAIERPGAVNAVLGVASDIVMSAALLVFVVFATRITFGFLRSGLRKSSGEAPDRLARLLHIVYWLLSAATACGAFWIAGEGSTTTHESYYATVIFSLAAVLPLLLGRSPARWLIPAGASVLFTASLVGLASNYFNVRTILPQYAPTITRLAEANHVQVGYTNWQDAAGLTWGTNNRVITRPLVECTIPEGFRELCPGFQAYLAAWYTPSPRETFLLADKAAIAIHTAPPGLGKPIAVYRFGPMSMYIYPYDIATRLGPAQN
jgi:hypothetical protein